LNIGCGHNILEGYDNIDRLKTTDSTIVADVFNLPYEEKSVDEIYMRHVIEHFYLDQLPQLFSGFRRVMKDDAELVMETPSLERIMYAWDNGLMKKEHLCGIMFGFYANENWRERTLEMHHKFLFDKGLAQKVLEENQFRDIRFEDAPKQFNYDPKYGDYNTAFVIRCRK